MSELPAIEPIPLLVAGLLNAPADRPTIALAPPPPASRNAIVLAPKSSESWVNAVGSSLEAALKERSPQPNVAGLAPDAAQGLDMARAALREGHVARVLERVVTSSQRLAGSGA